MRVSFIGSGNIATHLAHVFFENDIEIVDIYSLHLKNALDLSQKTGGKPINDLSQISTHTDLFFICVPDNFIEMVSAQLPLNIPHIHTFGNTNISLLKSTAKGVFYPLQTFSKSKSVNFKDMNILIEASSNELKENLNKLGNKIQANLFDINSNQRQKLHLAAVFACNFSNLMVNFAEEILEDNHLNKDFILPLLKETADKFINFPAKDAQTGPAKRGDQITIDKHAKLLEEFNPDLNKIYLQLTQEIQKRHGKL